MLNSLVFSVITLTSPGAIAFHLGPLQIRWYGIFIAVAFLIGYFLMEKLIIKSNLNLNYFNDLIFLVLIFSIIFARLYFVILSRDYFSVHLDEIPKIWHGGQSLHGGIFGAILAVLLYSKFKEISFYAYIDVIAVVLPFGQAVGRWGNFFNNEAFGVPVGTGFPCLVQLFIPQEYRPDQYINSEYFHPVFLYESILDSLIFLFLWQKYKKWKDKPGKTFWVYLLIYSIFRFFLEFVRVDSLYLFDNIASAHVVSVTIIVTSLYFLLKR